MSYRARRRTDSGRRHELVIIDGLTPGVSGVAPEFFTEASELGVHAALVLELGEKVQED